MSDFYKMQETKLDRAVDDAIRRENEAFIARRRTRQAEYRARRAKAVRSSFETPTQWGRGELKCPRN